MLHRFAAAALLGLAAACGSSGDTGMNASAEAPDEAVGTEGEIMADAALANDAAAAEAADAAFGGNMTAEEVSAADNNAPSDGSNGGG